MLFRSGRTKIASAVESYPEKLRSRRADRFVGESTGEVYLVDLIRIIELRIFGSYWPQLDLYHLAILYAIPPILT